MQRPLASLRAIGGPWLNCKHLKVAGQFVNIGRLPASLYASELVHLGALASLYGCEKLPLHNACLSLTCATCNLQVSRFLRLGLQCPSEPQYYMYTYIYIELADHRLAGWTRLRGSDHCFPVHHLWQLAEHLPTGSIAETTVAVDVWKARWLYVRRGPLIQMFHSLALSTLSWSHYFSHVHDARGAIVHESWLYLPPPNQSGCLVGHCKQSFSLVSLHIYIKLHQT